MPLLLGEFLQFCCLVYVTSVTFLIVPHFLPMSIEQRLLGAFLDVLWVMHMADLQATCTAHSKHKIY
jgi:hypothetical protein